MSGSLAELQEWMAVALQRPEQLQTGSAQAWIRSRPPLSESARLGIYQQAYQLRLIAALADDFPALRELLGEPWFEHLSAEYLRDHPSTHPNLNQLGAEFPGYLRAQPLGSIASVAADLARLEWAVVEAFHAPQDAAAALDPLLSLGAEAQAQARLRCSHSLRCLRLDHAVHRYLAAVQAEATPELPPVEPTGLLVYRHDFRVVRLAVPLPILDMVSALAAGRTLAQALACAADEDVQTWFASLTQDAVLLGLR